MPKKAKNSTEIRHSNQGMSFEVNFQRRYINTATGISKDAQIAYLQGVQAKTMKDSWDRKGNLDVTSFLLFEKAVKAELAIQRYQ